MERQVTTTEQPNLEGAKIGKDGTLNVASLSPSQQQTLRRIGAMALIGAGLLAPKDAEAVTLIQLNETNPKDNLAGAAIFWNGGSTSNMLVDRFSISEGTTLTEASVLANLRTSGGTYRDVNDPVWQTFRINLYKDVGGVPENIFTPSFSIAVNSSKILSISQTNIRDDMGQFFYKMRFELNQDLTTPGTYYMGIAFDATQHSGSALPSLRINANDLVPLNDPNMGMFANSSNQTWRGLQYPGTNDYFDPNYGLEAVPEPGTFMVAVVALGAYAAQRVKKAFSR